MPSTKKYVINIDSAGSKLHLNPDYEDLWCNLDREKILSFGERREVTREEAIAYRSGRARASLKPYQAKTEQLIKDTLILEDIDKTLPSFMIGPNYLEQIEEAGYDPEYEVAELRQAIRHYIRINIELNPVLETLGERLERLVKRKDPQEMKVYLKAIIEEINRLEAELEEKGLSPEEHALLIVASKHLEGQAEEGLIEFVKGLVQGLEDPSLIFPGWHTKAETRKNVKRTIFDACFNRFKDTSEGGTILDLTEDLMEYITRFRS